MVFNQQGVNLGTAHGKVVISTNVAQAMQQAQTEVRNGVQRIGASLQNIGNGISNVGVGLSKWTGPLAAIGAVGLKTAGNFQASMKEIEARTGLTGEALEKVRDQALDMGAITEFSAQQASDAFLQLLTAGLSVEQAQATLPNVLNAATASGEGLGLMADQVTNVMSAFSLEAEQTTDIVEAMSRAAASSPASMSQIGEALQIAGGDAKNFGLSLEDTAAVMAIFAQNGKRGSEGATQLRSILTAMTQDSEKNSEAWARLGTSLFDADGNARNFDEVLGEMRVGLERLNPEERARTIQTLAGSYGRTGLNALLASDGIGAMTDKMDEQQSAADVAAAKMGTFLGSITSLKGSIETLMIHALTPFMEDILTPLIKKLIDVVNAVASWAKENPELTKKIALFASGLVALGPILFVAGKAIALIGGAIAFLASPIALITGLIVGLAFLFVKEFDQIRAFVSPVVNNLANGFQRLFEQIGTFAAFVEDFGLRDTLLGILGIGNNIETQESLLEGLLVGFGVDRETAISIVGSITTALIRFLDNIQSVVEILRPLFTEIGTFLSNIFQNVDLGQIFEIGRTLLSLTNPIGIATTALKLFGVDVGDIFQSAVQAATRFFGELNDGGTVFDGLRAAFGDSSFIDGLETGFTNIVNFINLTVLPALQSLADWFTLDVLPGVLSFIQLTVIPGIDAFIGVLGQIWTDVSPFLTSLFDWFITTGLPLILDFINLTAVPVIEFMVGLLEGIWLAVSPALQDLYDWFITTGLPAIKDFIEGPFTTALTGVRDLLAGLWTFLAPHLEALKNNIKVVFDFIRINVLQPVLDILEDIIEGVGNFLETWGGIASDAGTILAADPEALAQVDVFNIIASEFGLRDKGGPGRAGVPYLIGKGAQPEVFVPSTDGQFIPNFDKLLAGAGGNGDISIGDINVYGANSFEEGRAAGQGVGDGVVERLRSRGVRR